MLRQGTKAHLLTCLENCVQSVPSQTHADVCILDGAVVVNFLKPLAIKTFEEYATIFFIPYLEERLENANRVDMVWDQYFHNSLKSQTRKKRGKGIRRRVEASSSLPNNWQHFFA